MSEIQFVEVDSEKIGTELITSFETAVGETLYPGDERRIFLQNFLPVLIALKNDINNTGKQTLLRFAQGDVLDAIGEAYGCARLEAQKAITTLRFTLSAVQTEDITIPLGTRVSPDGKLFFSTIIDSVIPAGQTYIDVTSEAEDAGASANGFTPGQIKLIVDPIAFVQSVSNQDTSSGGTDKESDEDYRSRIRLSPESYSVAGSTGAYEYWAKTADSTISDIAISSPSAGIVKIVVLLDGGVIPGQAILDKVNAVVSADKVRPLTDNVVVSSPTEATYNINMTYYIDSKNQTDEANIKSAIEGSGGAVEQYIAWQCKNLGKDINPDELRKLVLNAGAFRIDLTSPTFTAVASDAVAKIGTITITYGGLV